jgi:hypothetical protein
MAIAMIVIGGVLAGGAWSLHQQHFPVPAIAVCAVLAAMAIAAGIVWQV